MHRHNFPPEIIDAPRVRAAKRSTVAAASVYGLLGVIFFSTIFSEISEPIGLKFGRNAWIGPEGDNRDFHRDSFCSFF